ncbi:MAG: DUF2167 domain-containing protein [Burkholderiales bacterium]
MGASRIAESKLCAATGALLFAWCLLMTATAGAQVPEQAQAELKAAAQAAQKAAVHGPANVPLGQQGNLALPAGYQFVPPEPAARFMKALGNSTGANLLGMIAPQGDAGWLAVMNFVPAGYVKDDEAKDWNAAELLESLRKGTEQQNEERRSRGFQEIQVGGWVEPPKYDTTTHKLVWAASTLHKNAPPGEAQGVNYNTYVLGREGYISLNLITELNDIAKDKVDAQKLLAALNFNDGKKYADFNASTDKVAEYGIAALVGGIAAKKLGLFAVIAAFLLKFWKVGLLALAGIGLAFRKKNKPTDPPPSSGAPPA